MAEIKHSRNLRCSKCKEDKNENDFYVRNSRKRGRHYACKACCDAYYQTPKGKEVARRATKKFIRKLKHERPEEYQRRVFRQNLKKYGLTPERYEEMVKAQDGRCVICNTELLGGKQTHIDHNHDTGEVRAILCTLCNVGIGAFRERVDLLRKAIAYIEGMRQ